MLDRIDTNGIRPVAEPGRIAVGKAPRKEVSVSLGESADTSYT
jgi:hypothetical protein